MEAARLILEYIRVLVWPTVAIFAIILFRKQLAAILRRIKGAGLPGGVSLDLEEEVRDAQSLSREVARAARNRPAPDTPLLPLTEANERLISLGLQPSPSGLEVSRYLEMAQQDPAIALAGLRIEIETAARNLARGFNVVFHANDSVGLLLRRLLDKAAISEAQFDLMQVVLRLANAAVHGAEISREEAEAVVEVAGVLMKDYLAWLSWGFEDGWTPSGKGGSRQVGSAEA